MHRLRFGRSPKPPRVRSGRFCAHQQHAAGVGTGGTDSYAYGVASAGQPFKVSLVWSDYPSTEAASVNLVNNLNLKVTAPGGTVYWGNNFAGGWTVPGGSAEAVNNVENVYVQSAAAGTWTVEVIGGNVPQGPQPYALVVDGVLPGNEGRGYVLRRIIRRAIRHGNKLGATGPFFHKLVAPLAGQMGDAYPELRAAKDLVARVLRLEEEAAVYGLYQEELARRGQLDFGEQMSRTIDLLLERRSELALGVGLGERRQRRAHLDRRHRCRCGIVVAVVWEAFRVVAVSIAVAGVIALVTLLPRVQRWKEKGSPSFQA